MNKKALLLLLCFLTLLLKLPAQNIGIGTNTPTEKLDVNGVTKTTTLKIVTGGNISDFLIKSNTAGQVGFRKGHTGIGMNYIICLNGTFPGNGQPTAQPGPLTGQVSLWAVPNFAPSGWAYCEGQLLLINDYVALFSLLGTTYGGNGTTNFALPDMRNKVPVGGGSNWAIGENSN
jgi:microcystin-dependent protein